MKTSTKRKDLLEVAERLFYEKGFHGVGLKQITTKVNVATMTLYNHFSSKETLVEELLKEREKRYWSYLNKCVAMNSDSPFILIVETHGRWLKECSYKGDMFLRAIEDYAGTNNEIEKIARSHKQKLLRFFQQLACKKGKANQQVLPIHLLYC